MLRRARFGLGLVAGLYVTTAQAVPLDDAGFTAYVQQRLQLYATTPISIVAPLSLAVGGEPLPSLKPVHDACIREPAKCESATDAFVQNTVHDVLQKPAIPAASAPGVTTLVACNHTSRTLAVASVYVPVGTDQWRSVGWLNVDAGMCRGVLTTAGTTFYARAEEATREQIHDPRVLGGMAQGDHGIASAGSGASLCVAHTGNWDVTTASLEATCIGDARERSDFRMFHADGRPILMWNLAL